MMIVVLMWVRSLKGLHHLIAVLIDQDIAFMVHDRQPTNSGVLGILAELRDGEEQLFSRHKLNSLIHDTTFAIKMPLVAILIDVNRIFHLQ